MRASPSPSPSSTAAAAAAAASTDLAASRGRWVWLLGLALLLVAPFIGVYPVFLMNALCFAIFACAFNLLLGYTGLLSFGHAAFMGSAAYVTGWLVRSAGFSPELGILAGTLSAAVLGLFGGLGCHSPPGHLLCHGHSWPWRR